MEKHTPDLQFHNLGSFASCVPMTDTGRDWLLENIGAPDISDPHYDQALDYAGGVIIEFRYLADIVNGARADGLVCKG